MIYFTDQEIDQLLTEDVQYFDLTTSLLRLENKPAKISFTTRESAVICGSEEVMKVFQRTNIQTTLFTPSGEHLEKDVKFLEGEGLSGTLFAISRTVENMLRFASGVATRTRMLVEKAHEVNKEIVVSTTRKTIPGTRKLAVKAVRAGGASIHRLGLSESILVFRDHRNFLGGMENLEKRLKERKSFAGGKPIAVEAESFEDALKIAMGGADIIQLDKFTPGDIRKFKKEAVKFNPAVKIAAAGNINLKNVQDYAASGADMLVASWPYYGEPADMTVCIQPIYEQF